MGLIFNYATLKITLCINNLMSAMVSNIEVISARICAINLEQNAEGAHQICSQVNDVMV